MSIFGQQKRTARPLNGGGAANAMRGAFRDGSLGLRGPYVTTDGSLGQALGTIPWQCWNVSAFQNCHQQQFGINQRDCAGGIAARDFDGNMDNCINALTDIGDGMECVPKYCQEFAAAPRPNIASISVAEGKKIQTQINALLVKNGFKPIVVDGVIGKATCGADAILHTGLLDGYQGLCAGGVMTYPTKVGQTKPVTVMTLPTTVVQQGQAAQPLLTHQWGQPDPQMAALQTDCNRILDQNEMISIPITGVLDAATCGAMKWIKENTGTDLLTASGQNCQGFTLPSKKPASISPQNALPGSPPPSALIATPAPPGGLTSASMLTGGLLLLAAGGAYYYAKKKGMV